MESLLSAEHITICYNGIPAVQDVSFQVKPGEILGYRRRIRKRGRALSSEGSWGFWERAA